MTESTENNMGYYDTEAQIPEGIVITKEIEHDPFVKKYDYYISDDVMWDDMSAGTPEDIYDENSDIKKSGILWAKIIKSILVFSVGLACLIFNGFVLLIFISDLPNDIDVTILLGTYFGGIVLFNILQLLVSVLTILPFVDKIEKKIPVYRKLAASNGVIQGIVRTIMYPISYVAFNIALIIFDILLLFLIILIEVIFNI